MLSGKRCQLQWNSTLNPLITELYSMEVTLIEHTTFPLLS